MPVPDSEISVSTRFFNSIMNAFEITGRQVVILIDEYDQPLLQNIEQGKEDLHQEMREHLQAFYSVMKSQDRYIRFGMLSGISKFSMVSVFSGLNNLNDISLDIQTNAICGISESELARDFQVGIRQLAEVNGITVEEAREKLRHNYDGYHFAKTGEGIYNPFSLLSAFNKDHLGYYWIISGVPNIITPLLNKTGWHNLETGEIFCTEFSLNKSEGTIPQLYDNGILTIRQYDSEFSGYILDFPNEEMRTLVLDILKH